MARKGHRIISLSGPKVYAALWSFPAGLDPVLDSVLEDTLNANIGLTYNASGRISVVADSGTFVLNKSAVIFSAGVCDVSGAGIVPAWIRGSTSAGQIKFFDGAGSESEPANGSQWFIEFRIYE